MHFVPGINILPASCESVNKKRLSNPQTAGNSTMKENISIGTYTHRCNCKSKYGSIKEVRTTHITIYSS